METIAFSLVENEGFGRLIHHWQPRRIYWARNKFSKFSLLSTQILIHLSNHGFLPGPSGVHLTVQLHLLHVILHLAEHVTVILLFIYFFRLNYFVVFS